jgi:4-hydroxyphenylacetate 3-monooxygenase
MRSGGAYVASLRDGRAVYVDGERVDDVTKHPAFAAPIRRIAETYDRAKTIGSDSALTFADPATGERHSNMWLVPRSADDLGARRRVHRFWAEQSFGLMGRTPDHVACVR